jgi:hypothetical protein
VSPDHDAIDELIVGGTSYREITKRFGVSISALSRHRQDHLSPALKAVLVARDATATEGLADRVERLYMRAEGILNAAEADGRGSLGISAIRELRSLCELLGRLSGELDERPTLQVVNIQASPDWIALRTAILTTLDGYPDARAAVLEALSASSGRRELSA